MCRCHSRSESEGSITYRQQSMQARKSTLALKPRADITRSLKQWYHCPPPKKTIMSSHIFCKTSTFRPTHGLDVYEPDTWYYVGNIQVDEIKAMFPHEASVYEIMYLIILHFDSKIYWKIRLHSRHCRFDQTCNPCYNEKIDHEPLHLHPKYVLVLFVIIAVILNVKRKWQLKCLLLELLHDYILYSSFCIHQQQATNFNKD